MIWEFKKISEGTSCLFVINNVQDLLNVLVPILDINPLHTTKYLDFLDFKAAAVLLSYLPTTRPVLFSSQIVDLGIKRGFSLSP